MAVENKSIRAWLGDMAEWICPNCGAVAHVSDTSCRWNGSAWEHRCPGNHPQCGCTVMERRSLETPPGGPQEAIITEGAVIINQDMGAGGEVSPGNPFPGSNLGWMIGTGIGSAAGASFVAPEGHPAPFGSDKGTFIIAEDFDDPLEGLEIVPLMETGGSLYPLTSAEPGEAPDLTVMGCKVVNVFPPPGGLLERSVLEYENDLFR